MMFCFFNTILIWIPAVLLIAVNTQYIRRAGWLDRVVAYHKNKFYADVEKFAPINLNATITRAPPGYVDSEDWTYESVLRLLTLIRQSETTKPLLKQLRRMMPQTRRIMMSMKDSMKRFPSMMKHERNEFYYSVEYSSEEDEFGYPPPMVPDDEVVLVVSNPVEARLPSARISVKLLREILEARAKAARVLETTLKSTIYWKPMNKSTTACDNATKPDADGDGGGTPTTKVDGEGDHGGKGGEGEGGATKAPPEGDPQGTEAAGGGTEAAGETTQAT